MKKLYIFFLLLGLRGMSQTVEIPNMALPSPQAFELTKFGNTPVDESTGRVSPSIPVCTYTVGALQVPISLSYSGNGVKVEQKPTWTGINWLLNAGGVITRVVKDLPDETDKPRMFYSEGELDLLRTYYATYEHAWPVPNHPGQFTYTYTTETSTTPFTVTPNMVSTWSTVRDDIKNGLAGHPENADSQPDDFSFTFPGYSGSFVLVKNTANVFEAKLLKYDNELKIEILGDFSMNGSVIHDYEFKITTPDGTSYYFGGEVDALGATELGNTTEESQFVDRSGGIPEFGVRAKTAFYLTKIQNYLGDAIFLEYYTKDQHETFAASGMQLEELLAGYSDTNGPAQCPPPASNHSFAQKYIKNIIYNAKFLKRMWNHQTGQEVIFNSFESTANLLTQGAFNSKFRVLSSIDYELGKVDFDYLPNKVSLETNTEREKFFLEKVTFKNADGTLKKEEYTMEYNDALSVPKSAFSAAQDFLGYYNGKTDNASLLPKNSLSYSQPYFQKFLDENNGMTLPSQLGYGDFSTYSASLGDRSSSFAYASKGLLTKITYPTKGSTVFEYEPAEKDKFLYQMNNMNIYKRWVGNYPEQDWAGVGYEFFQLHEGEGPPPNPYTGYPSLVNQTASIQLTIDVDRPNGYSIRDYVYVEKRLPSGQIVERKTWHFPTPSFSQNPVLQFTTTMEFPLGEGEVCGFFMGFADSPVGTGTLSSPDSPTKAHVSASFQYISGNDNDGSGIRIKRVKDYENNTANAAPTNIRRYYYKGLKDVIQNKKDVKVPHFKPLFHSFRTVINSICEVEGGLAGVGAHDHNLYITLNTNSFTQNFPGSDVFALYPCVTISLGGDDFEQGAIQKGFITQSDTYQTLYGTASLYPVKIVRAFSIYNDAITTNLSNFNGLLYDESIWRKENGILEKIKHQKTHYGFHITDVLHNVNAFKMYAAQLDVVPQNLFFGLYHTNSHKINSTVTTTTEFIGGIPITKYITEPFALYQHWQTGNHDGDSDLNVDDPQFITPPEFEVMTDEEIEDPFYQLVTNKRIVNTQEVVYNQLAGLPSSAKTTNSNGEIKETKNFYPITHDIDALSSTLSLPEITALNALQNKFRIGEPFQVENWKGLENAEKLSTQRTVYTKLSEDDGPSSLRKYKMQTSKGAATLEDRIIYHKYDERGNPVELSLANGTKVVYIWSYKRKPIYKIVNANYDEVLAAMTSGGVFDPTEDDGTGPEIITNPFITLLPRAQVTIYNYDPITQLIRSVVNTNGDTSYYNYDAFLRLKEIKDKDGNILQEFESQYRTN